MAVNGKLGKLLSNSRTPKEVEDWIFSLTPLGVAFSFFLMFMLPMEIPNKIPILVIGFAAGFTGLQTYWVFRGWRKNHLSTILLGITGIVITMLLAWFYLSLA